MATPYFRRPHMTGRNGSHSHLTPWASVAVRSTQPTHTHTANAPSYSWLVEAVECSGRARIPEDIWGGFSVGNSHSATPAHPWQYALGHWACIRYTLYAISVCALCIMFCGLCGLSTMVLLSPFTTLGAGRSYRSLSLPPHQAIPKSPKDASAHEMCVCPIITPHHRIAWAPLIQLHILFVGKSGCGHARHVVYNNNDIFSKQVSFAPAHIPPSTIQTERISECFCV